MQLKAETSLLNGRYIIKSCIGDGGFGITYLAWDVRLDREIVLKEYFPDYLVKRDTTVTNEVVTIEQKGSEDFHNGINKFLNEAKTLAHLNHIQSIASVYDFFEENNTAYIVMEYIKGQNLKQVIKSRQTPFSYAEAIELLGPCMVALQRVHEAGIIHRDFAPDNILVNERGQVKIIDFGASREFVANNSTMTIMVKHGYAPAEQYSNAVKQGPYTDVYSLAAIFYEMLTLQKPMPSVDRMFTDTLKKPSEINYSVSAAQDAVIMKGMAVNYSQRFMTVEEFHSAVLDANRIDAVPIQFEQNPVQNALAGTGNAVAASVTQGGLAGESTEVVSYSGATEVMTSGGAATEVLSASQQAEMRNLAGQFQNGTFQTNGYQNSGYQANGYQNGGFTSNYNPNSQGYANQSMQTSGEQPKNKKGLKIALIAIAAAVVFGVIGLAVANSSGTDKTKKSKKDTTETEATVAEAAPAAEAPAAATPAVEAPVEEAAPAAEPVSAEGEVLNIRCWNEEFKSRITDHYPGYEEIDATTGRIGNVRVNWIIVPSDDNAYQNSLDAALLDQYAVTDDDKLDMFLVEADYALKYVDTDYAMPVSELGISNSELSNQYKYTQEVVTDSYGNLKGVSWQACPGIMFYNRQAAKEILGTDDPSAVQAAVKDWDSFADTAYSASTKGYKMTATANDMYRVFANNMSVPWVTNGRINVDENLKTWVGLSKWMVDNRITTTSELWSDDWSSGFFPEGKVFCYFGPAWFINFCMYADYDGTIGNKGGWGAVVGPQSFYWGGTWMCAAEGTDNPTLVADIMRQMTCNEQIMTEIVRMDDDFVNNQPAMEKMARDSSYKSYILGGINPLQYYVDGAKKIDMSNVTAYDQGCNEAFQDAMCYYFEGRMTWEEALSYFYESVCQKYPELS